MEWNRIRERPEDRAGANLANYEEFYAAFSWAQARRLLDKTPGGSLNIAHLTIDRAFSLLGRVAELYLAALGTLKNGSVFSPLFSAFGPEPIKARMTIGDAKVLVTSEAFYRRKIEPWRRELASLEHVLPTECSDAPPVGTTDLAAAMAAASESFETVRTEPEDMALLHFTSGTTGRPKGAVHVHEAVVAQHRPRSV